MLREVGASIATFHKLGGGTDGGGGSGHMVLTGNIIKDLDIHVGGLGVKDNHCGATIEE